MRVLLLSQWFQPETTFKGLPFAKALQAMGHDVEVLTGFPNYPSGKIYPPYRLQPRLIEEIDGVRVVRVALYPSHDRSAVRRSLNYLSFAASASTIGLLSAGMPDVVYVSHPPATAGLPAILNRALRGVPFVLDIQDLWPDSLAATGMFNSTAGLWALTQYCNGLYRTAAHVTVVSKGFEKVLVSRGVEASKLSVVYNWAEDDVIRPDERDEELATALGLAGRFNVMFTGNIGLAQGLDVMLEAAELVRERSPRVQFVLVGGGVDLARLKEAATRRCLSNVLFIDRRPNSEMSKLFALGDVLFAHLRDCELFRITIPSKLQSYMAAGRPVLSAVRGEAAELVNESGAGVNCEPDDPQQLADVVVDLAQRNSHDLAQMGARGRQFYVDRMSLTVGALRFSRIFEDVVAMKRSR